MSTRQQPSLFLKECPHCKALIDVRALKRVPRKTKLRWYQFTPSPHMACPRCGGFVVSTIGNSLLFIIPTAAALLFSIAALYIPQAKAVFEAIPGLPYTAAVLVALFAWHAQRSSTLLPESAKKL